MYEKCLAQGQECSVIISTIITTTTIIIILRDSVALWSNSIGSSYMTCVQAPVLPFTSSVTAGKLYSLSVFVTISVRWEDHSTFLT